jgi:N6-adenosine-specific RNA methylase IME4
VAAGKYRTIVADPPWAYGLSNRPGWSWREGRPSGEARSLDYPEMTLDDIAVLPVPNLAAKDAHLYLWTTQRYLHDAFHVAEWWGFRPSLTLVWCKDTHGLIFGATFQPTTEFVIFARRGSLKALTKVESQWFRWPKRGHSEKPEAFMDIVESVSPEPRLEMFSRRARLGWDTWGNEALMGESVTKSVQTEAVA